MAGSGKSDGGWIGPLIQLGIAVIGAIATVATTVWSSKTSQVQEKKLREKLEDLEISKKKYNLSEEQYQQQKKKILETHEYETRQSQ